MGLNLQGYSRAKWRELGYKVEAGEHVSRIGQIVRRHDTFGFADLIAVREGEMVLLQVTSWGNVSARANKIARDFHGRGQWARPIKEYATDLLAIPGVRIVVEGWKLDKTLNRWVSRQIEVTPEELERRTR